MTTSTSTPQAPEMGTGQISEDPVVQAAARQGVAVIGLLRRTNPQAWLFAERARYLRDGTCNPYAEQLLRQAGFLRG
ncbi:hypothetical protein [Gephyromycinifex aptenodytis]|uniref:hypothetical protein n=1 Tax=Gephyromycinifex aptenodytis TaxID=2716227 RepID=UPI0014477A84|nr:hypothetical protein [Gephyromycinifex aptenodytis]